MNAILALLLGSAAVAHGPCPARLAPCAALLRVTTATGAFEAYEILDRAGDRSAALRRDGGSLVLELDDARRSIDAEGVYGDWSCLVPLLMALPLREGASFEARVAAQAQPEPTWQRFEVGAARTLRMAWGEERAWPVSQRGNGVPTLRHWLRDRAPHVRLQVEFEGQPVRGATTLAIHEPAGVSSAADCPARVAP